MAKTEKTLSHDDILAADDLKTAIVNVPEWGGDVQVRELTAAQKMEVGTWAMREDGTVNVERAGDVPILAATYGLGLSRDKMAAIGAKNATAVERIAEKVMAMSGMEVDAAVDFLPDTKPGDSPSG